MGYRESLDRGYSSRSRTEQEAMNCLGCMLCSSKVEVDFDYYSAGQAFVEQVDGMVPFTVSAAASKSECGLSAVNGDCSNQENIELIADMIASGDVPGVHLKG